MDSGTRGITDACGHKEAQVLKELLNKLRAGKTDDAAEQGPPAASHAAGGLRLALLVAPLFFVSAAVMVVVAVITYLQFLASGRSQQEAVFTAQAAQMAAHLAGRVQGYGDVLAAAAQQPALVTAVQAGDRDAVTAQLSALHAAFPGVVRVRLIAAGETQTDETTTPGLGYACLELARQAEQGGLPPMEVHLPGSKDQHVDLLRPVRGADGVLGSLLLSFDVALLKTWLAAALPPGGYAELRQGGAADAVRLTVAGDASLLGDGDGTGARVSGTSWQVVYWSPEGAPSVSGAQQAMFLTVFGLAVAVLVLVFGVFAAAWTRLVRNDMVAVVKQAAAILSGRRQHNYEVKLAESREVLVALEQRMGYGPAGGDAGMDPPMFTADDALLREDAPPATPGREP